MRLSRRLAAIGGIVALGVTGPLTVSAAATTEHRAVGHVYVNDNTTGTNTIAAFDRHSDGTLTPTPGSPFAAGGVGTGHGVGSQGALQMSSDGRYLLAVDAGSNEISVLRITHNGALRRVEGGPVSSGGTEPVSIAVSTAATRDHEHSRADEERQLVYVANAGIGGSNYTGFTLGDDGHLHPIAGSTIALQDGSTPGDILFSADGTHLAATRVGTSMIDSFRVGPDGHLIPAPGSPIPAQGPGPFGSEFSPTSPGRLFVSNAHGGAGNGTVSAFSVARNGSLTSIGASPFPDHQTAPCWVEITHDGKFLFTVNTAVPSISRYSIALDGSLTLFGSTPFNSPAGLGPEDARLSPDGATLWVVDTAGAAISAFAVNGGNLTELSTSPTPVPAGAAPFGIVVD